MKYSRGRIIALTILSVTMVLALFGSGLFLNYRPFHTNAADSETPILDPNYIPTFDDLYARIPFDATDTGTVTLGQSTTLTLLEERYTRSSLTNFLNMETSGTNRPSYDEFRDFQINSQNGYSYPIFSNTEMRQIATGLGNNLEIPVVMLDPYNYDDVVLLELTNITDMPSDLTITRDGVTLSDQIYQVDAKYTAEQVYAGIPNQTAVGGTTIEDTIDDTDGTVLLTVICTPNSNSVNGYTATIKDAAGNDLFLGGETITAINDGTTQLYDEKGVYLYRVVRTGNAIEVYDARNGTPEAEQNLLGTVRYTNSQFTDYKIGAVAYNANALRGMFREQGFYQITFKQKIAMGDGVFSQVDVAIAFVIVNKINYNDFPRFDLGNRVSGNSEIYNYSYESTYPTVTYSSYYFDVVVQSTEKITENDQNDAQRKLQFYRIGEYHMTSTLRYYSWYLFNRENDFRNRGVEKGYITLKRYATYSSILNILGFQAYYGGGYDAVTYPESKNGQLPFYDSLDAEVSSDISAWVRNAEMTAGESGSVVDYQNMRVSDALTYSTELANYISNNGLVPVRTNFPPVKLYSNVGHATGAGTNGEAAAVLSTVAFKAANGTGNTSEWVSSTLEIGAPYEEAGQYVIAVYFKVNGEICQQTFFFEIVNAAKIAFDVTSGNDPEPKTYYVGELVLNQTLSGKTIKINYDGNTTLGQFEVPPTVTLAYADFGSYEYHNLGIPMGENGAFSFSLQPGQFRLTIKYGAQGKSTSVFNIVVDNTLATGIQAHTDAIALTGLPENIAIVGAGAVNLTWDQKSSGIDYNNVLCEFYEMKLNNGVDPNADRNYTNFGTTTSTNLYAAYAFSQTASRPNDGYQPIKTDDGWTLNETFTTAGLYRFTLIDDVGNETYFVLIIDTSTPTFVQSAESAIDTTNAVKLDAKQGVKIGFGTQKLITDQSENHVMITGTHGAIFNALRETGRLVDEIGGTGKGLSTSVSVGLSKIEYSSSGTIYRDVKEVFPLDDIKNGFVVLWEEGTYYFRVTDVLGNVGEYYVILTNDNCFGMVYAETNYDACSLLTDSEYRNRGMVATEPGAATSLVTNTGGMTNRPYVTFSFCQQDKNEDYRVKRIYLQYYPFTYDPTSANYPFAEKPQNNPSDANNNRLFNSQDNNGLIYSVSEGDSSGTIRLALFNTKTTTPSGMYIITRIYEQTPGGTAGFSDTEERDYYFIVDDQKMLAYFNDETKSYQTELKVHFADNKNAQAPQAKDADAAVFAANHNELSSNRTAWITGFNSKYSCYHDSTTYTIEYANYLANYDSPNYTFPALIPRFSYLYQNQTINLGEGYLSEPWAVGDPASRGDSTVYKLVVADNARSLSCSLANGNMVELKADANAPTSANYDYLILNLDTGYGTKAAILVDNDKIISNSRMEYDGDSYVYVVDPTQIDQLKFRFESDPASMYADVDLEATIASWRSNGFTQNVAFALPTPINHQYTFDLMQDFLKNTAISDGASLSVTLSTYDNTQTNYTILFDIHNPEYNVNRIKDGDNLACTMTKLPGDYVYGLSDEFVFESDHEHSPYLDAKIITYREVDSTGEGTQAAVQFKLYTGADGEARIPFAQLVGLRDNEMKYYFISETDYAGHTTNYRVQIQGSNFVNAITFIGALSEYEDANTKIGVEMHASSSSVHQFFVRNHSFKFESGDEHYTVLGSTASWHIGDDIGTGSASEEKLLNALNNWINVSTEKGTKCSYTLYDRIGEIEVFDFYNIRESAAKVQLDCYQTSLSSNIIMAVVTNYDDLPAILFNEDLVSLFKIKVEDKTEPDASFDGYFSLYGTQIRSPVTHELVITVTDPFGRTSVTEYHQQTQSTIIFDYYGNTVTENGVLYIGDERGVNFSYLSTVYKVLIYDAGTGELLSDLQSFISNNMISYQFVPQQEASTIQQYHIVATGRASGAILFEQTFVFDTRLPSVEWKNSSDQTIEVEDQTFVSAVIFDISKSLVPTAFPVSVSYVRTLGNYVERVTLRAGTQKYTFDQEGSYEVTVRNAVWAKKTYKFEIVQIDDTLVLVYDGDKLLQASPSEYKFNDTYIPRYVFAMKENSNGSIPLANYQAHNLRIQVGQTNRTLAGNPILGTDYFYYDEINATLVWRLAFQTGEVDGIPAYTSPIYFATTGVTPNELNKGTAISLRLNGNPVGSGNNFVVSPSTTTYHEITNSFMEAHDKKVEVSLYCEDILTDDFGAPCNLVRGNVILVDCYYNGKLIKTISYGEVFTINQYDAGFYEFTVHDLVDSYLYFGSNKSDKNDILYRQERYMLAVMTKPLVLINNKEPVNDMVYNDQVELKLVDYGHEFLTKRYASELEQDENFFRSHFCITKMEVQYTGSNGTSRNNIAVNGSQSVFYWSNTGSYHIRLTYSLGTNISDTLQAEYQFQIIPAYTIRESFSMPILPNIQVVSVTRDGYKVHDVDKLQVNESMNFNADDNPGSYVVTLRTYNNILEDYITHEVRFNIRHKANSAANYFVLSSGSGTSTVGAVALYYNPYWLYSTQGEMTIYLYKDFVEQERVTVNASALSSGNYDSLQLFNVSNTGLYTVKAFDAEGDLIYSDSWTVEEEQSTFGYIILAVVLGVAGVGILVFMRMRRKMTTK
ncbi:MAG: hypothetical protein NC133_00555 [Prevotella sp.]|nr:hypothetical protein [Prevotella sp.]